MMKLLIATTNKGKIKEIESLLSTAPVECITPSGILADLQVEETGASYSENASLKALTYAGIARMPVLADDTGLEVDALEGAPGLHSARFSTVPGATDSDRRMKLLSVLHGKPQPWTARFRCVVAVAFPGEEVRLFDGSVEGEIVETESGNHGFGYDRIFWIPRAGKTMADLEMEEKNRFSHRAIAVAKAVPYILKTIFKD